MVYLDADETSKGETSKGAKESGPSERADHSQVISRHKIEIDKFDGNNNFNMWRVEVIDALTAQDLEETITEDEKPDDITDRKWEKMNCIACGLIRSCLSQDVKYLVLEKTVAKKMWKILGDQYLSRAVEARFRLKLRLANFSMKTGISISQHLTDFTKLMTDVHSVGIEVSEEDKAVAIIKSLPNSYNAWIEGYISSAKIVNGEISITYADLSYMLLNRQFWTDEESLSSSYKSEALVVTNQPRGRQ